MVNETFKTNKFVFKNGLGNLMPVVIVRILVIEFGRYFELGILLAIVET